MPGTPRRSIVAGEGGRDRAGHQHVAVLAPFDLQFAAVHHDRGAAAGQAAAVRVHQRGAGAGAAGQRQAGAALPHAQPDPVRRQHLGEADIGALREQRIVLQARARAPPPARAPGRRTKNVACGLPMLAAAGSATGPSARSRCSVSIGRASGMSGQSSRAGPMSTLHPAVRQRLGGQVAGDGADHLAAAGRSRAPADAATQRVALPQAPASAPSGLRMRMKASALESSGGGSMTMNWSQPTPVRRSAIAARAAPR